MLHHHLEVSLKQNLVPALPLRVSSSDCRYESSEGGNDIRSCQTLYPLPTSFFLFPFIFSVVGSTLCSFSAQIKVCPLAIKEPCWAKGTACFFIFFQGPTKILVSFPGCLGNCCWLTLRYTHTTTTTVTDMSFGT